MEELIEDPFADCTAQIAQQQDHLELKNPISTMYADARVQKIYGGSNEIMKELIARSLTA